jgi:Protein of unknown function (DUF2587)
VKHAVSAELRGELSDLGFSLERSASSDSELRLAQAQLVGWLKGLFIGLQAAAMNQARLPGPVASAEPVGSRRAMGGYA